jgi:hypothetical protein
MPRKRPKIPQNVKGQNTRKPNKPHVSVTFIVVSDNYAAQRVSATCFCRKMNINRGMTKQEKYAREVQYN